MMKTYGYTRIGTTREKNQDSVMRSETFIAVSDGIGSCQYSRVSSEYAVSRIALKFSIFCAKQPTNEEVNTLLSNGVSPAMKEYARNIGIDRSDIGCTLATVANVNGKTHVLTVGDSYAVIIFKDGTHIVITQIKSDDMLANETSDLVSSSNYLGARYIVFDSNTIKRVLCFTDGAEWLAENIEACKEIQSKEDLTKCIDFLQANDVHDDITIVVADY